MRPPASAVFRLVGSLVLGMVVGAAGMAVWLGRSEPSMVSTVAAASSVGQTAAAVGVPASVVHRDGTYLVGVDLMAGRYVTRSIGAACYYAVTTDLTGSLRSVVTTHFGDAFGRRADLADGQYFETDECGGWTREAPLPPGPDQ